MKDMDIEAKAALLWLECKRVLRDGGPSYFFPELTPEIAMAIRSQGLEKAKEFLNV